MSRFLASKADAGRVCDPRRVSLAEGCLSRRSSFDATVVFGVLAALTLTTLALIGASSGSLVIVGVGFAGLLAFCARAYLLDLAAGAVLRFVQPFRVGDTIHLFSADAHDYVDATVIKLGAARTTLAVPAGVLVVPNHNMLSDQSAA
jgi:small-conductance mechanosensitive channel